MTLDEFYEVLDEYIAQALSLPQMLGIPDRALSTDIKDIDLLAIAIEKLHELTLKGLLDDDTCWTWSVYTGTLLGEMIINEHGFHWAMYDESTPCVETDDNAKFFPITKMYKILKSDEDDWEGSPTAFYESGMAMLKYQAMTDEEKEKITVYIGEDDKEELKNGY